MFRNPALVDLRHADRNIGQAAGCLSYVRDYICVSSCLPHSIRRSMTKNAHRPLSVDLYQEDRNI